MFYICLWYNGLLGHISCLIYKVYFLLFCSVVSYNSISYPSCPFVYWSHCIHSDNFFFFWHISCYAHIFFDSIYTYLKNGIFFETSIFSSPLLHPWVEHINKLWRNKKKDWMVSILKNVYDQIWLLTCHDRNTTFIILTCIPSLNTQSCIKGLLVVRDFCFRAIWAAKLFNDVKGNFFFFLKIL